MTRGQTTVEFVVIAAMILLILGGLFSIFYTVTPIASNQNVLHSKTYWQNADFFIGGFHPSEEVLNITLRNNLPYAVTILNISFNSILFADPSVVLTPGATLNVEHSFNSTEFVDVEVWYINNDNGITYPFFGVTKLQFDT